MAWKNKELQKKYEHARYLKNRDKFISQAKDYYNNHKEIRKKQIKENGWSKRYPDKAKKSRDNWKKNNPEKLLEYKLQSRFGIGIQDYNILFIKQGGCCDICKRHQSELNKKLFIDHNHKTGKIRGLLCFNCNTALGFLNDNPELFLKAKKYLEKYI